MTAAPFLKMTAEEKEDRLTEAHDTMAREVEKLRTSDDWKRWLTTASKFHKYSFNNVLLMMAQAAEREMAPISYCAGFKAWLALNRGVRKGEKGLRIFAPIIVKLKPDEKGFPGTKLVGFRLTSVFDLQQTDGEPLPERPTYTYPNGEVPDGLIGRLFAYAETVGFPADFGNTDPADGYTDPTGKVIRISEKFRDNDARVARTMIHELAHAELHTQGDFDYRQHRGIAETEAESVAFMVGTFFGIDMADCSFHYVAGWAPDLETVSLVGQRVMNTAKKIIAAVEVA